MPPRFDELIDRHHDELFAYLWRLLGKNRGADAGLEVEDIVQDVFLRAFENYPRLRPHSNPRAWLYKIATHSAFNRLRRAKLARASLADLERKGTENTAAPGGALMTERVKRFVIALPARQKACVTLRYLQDLDYAEIAEALNCSEAAARANVYQALRRLRQALKEER